VSFKLPANLSTLSDAELSQLLAEGTSELDALFAIERPSATDVSEAQRISPLLRQIETEISGRATSAAELSAQMAVVREAHAPAAEEPEVTATEPAPEPEPVVQAAVEPAEVVTAEVVQLLHREDLVQAATESDAEFRARQGRYPARDETIAASITEGAPVVPAVAVLASRTPRPQRPDNGAAITITAAADVPDFATGSRIESMRDVANAVIKRMQAFPAYRHDSKAQRSPTYGVASFRTEYPEDLICHNDRNDYEVIQRAAKESRLPGGALTAAGGWCAPSQNIYDLCEAETTEGILQVPEVQVVRGGVNTTLGPDFSTIFTDAGFQLTEAEVIAGSPAKTCYEVPCPDFDEVRLDAVGMCISAPLLTNAGYPELVARVVRGAIVAHQHQINVRVIDTISTALGAAVSAADLSGVAASTLAGLELIAESLRSSFRMGFNTTMEVVAPHWLLGAIRADLSLRTGQPLEAITDQQINSLFASRKVAVQWVYGFQDLDDACAVAYPDEVDLLVYPAGTFVKGVAPVINLGTVYDQASLLANMYTALFMEEGVLVTQSCFGGCKVTIPVCTAGRTGINDVTCA
jgi:hypothetical protein